ncbi:MraY family glycosyltransferase [Treponema phagedenis]|uniref:MraY family glycosyltransferase n=1 Tax=Treponema phagedenis TaxID=162 RepID=UPI0011E6CF5D|nr:MraY family glycosyltransferase [Treponema phagedenis]QEK05796.1 undecaprenyl/decaprenyl-phosphate alpha-N-acetylglucosaminyl 1-phosphate transferase [Treponema phagedenis]
MLNAFILLFAFILSYISILLVIKFSQRYGLYDTIDERKVHSGNVPRLGGLGVIIGFTVTIVLSICIKYYKVPYISNIWFLVGAGILIFWMGVWDDIKPWKAKYKLAVQCTAAIIVLAGNFKFTFISFSPFSSYLKLGWFAYPFTFIWIVGIINAINLIDGIDGLSGSITFLSLLMYTVLFYFYDNKITSFFCLILMCSIAGFLVFNLPFPRAKIFLGDGGSQFLGFTFGVLPLMKTTSSIEAITFPYTFVLLSIPILDTFAAIWRRAKEHKPLGTPDKLHIHHKLMLLGFSSRETLVILICIQLFLTILVTVASVLRGIIAFVLLLLAFSTVFLFFTFIHYAKERKLQLLQESEDNPENI